MNVALDAQVFQSNIIGLDPWWTDPLYSAYLEREVCNPGLEITVRLEYDYSENAVPEPTTLALLGIGMLGVGMRTRRRSQPTR